jgi:hypothetical protein
MGVVLGVEQREPERVARHHRDRARHEGVDLLPGEHAARGEVLLEKWVDRLHLLREERDGGDDDGAGAGDVGRRRLAGGGQGNDDGEQGTGAPRHERGSAVG